MKTIIFLISQFLFGTIVFAQSIEDSTTKINKWSDWTMDTTLNEKGEIQEVTKSKFKCPSTTCHFISTITKYANRKWYWKQKKKDIVACFGGGSKVIWTRKRKITAANKD